MSGVPQIVVRTPDAVTAKPIALNASPKWPDVKDDSVVRYDGHLIDRMRLGERYSHGTTWEWSITVPMAMPVWANGTADSRRPVGNASIGLGSWSERSRHVNKGAE
jgi:hypothetical protein